MSSHIQGITLSESLINSIFHDEIDGAYLEKVASVNQLIINSKTSEYTDCRSILEMKPELEKLKLKICVRARQFLMVKINNLRKPKTNFQILQESVLLRFKPLLTFLKEHSQETFVEITNYYSEVMS